MATFLSSDLFVARVVAEVLADVGRQRLRADHVLAGFGRGYSHRPMQGVGDAQVNDVDRVERQQLIQVVADLVDAVTRRVAGSVVTGSGGDRLQANAVGRAVAASAGLGKEAGTDDANSDVRCLVHAGILAPSH